MDLNWIILFLVSIQQMVSYINNYTEVIFLVNITAFMYDMESSSGVIKIT